ncbi:tracheary element differentiation-related 6 [Striga hermonthica]|uniref:Tracheary element differentiation-related 6 n=1 Tax=Striga hermonthica TaxID=68872 RepID=A0A9N7NH18_STRHE|nr:tracheary element differentiation-related 6 [Striga hermonthica]
MESSDDGPTVIVVVLVTFGCFFFAVLCFFALWCCLIKNKRKKKTFEETDLIVTDKHRRVKEAIVPGPQGPRAVVLSVEEDKHTQEKIIKNEVEEKEMHAQTGEKVVDITDVETGESSNPSTHQTH